MGEPQSKSIPELIIELIELGNAYARQEIKSIVDSSVIQPLKEVGRWLALATVASTLIALAFIFLAVGAFQLLARMVEAPWIAYLIVGGVLMLAGIAVSVAMMRKDTD